MSNEPRYSLRQVGARIELDDYARILQLLDTVFDQNGKKMFRDVSHVVRDAISEYVRCVNLDKEHFAWAEEQKRLNVIKRSNKRRKRRFLYDRIKRIFHRK